MNAHQCAVCGEFDGHQYWCAFAPKYGTTTGNTTLLEEHFWKLANDQRPSTAELDAFVSKHFWELIEGD